MEICKGVAYEIQLSTTRRNMWKMHTDVIDLNQKTLNGVWRCKNYIEKEKSKDENISNRPTEI